MTDNKQNKFGGRLAFGKGKELSGITVKMDPRSLEKRDRTKAGWAWKMLEADKETPVTTWTLEEIERADLQWYEPRGATLPPNDWESSGMGYRDRTMDELLNSEVL